MLLVHMTSTESKRERKRKKRGKERERKRKTPRGSGSPLGEKFSILSEASVKGGPYSAAKPRRTPKNTKFFPGGSLTTK